MSVNRATIDESADLKKSSHQQLTRYLSHYHFERDPFADVGRSGLFFPGAGRHQVVETLLHFSRYGNSPVFLSGAAGAGKTLLVHHFFTQLESDVSALLVSAELMMTRAQLYKKLLAGIDRGEESLDDETAVVGMLVDYIDQESQNGRQVLIAIDNIQDLTVDVIAALFALFVKSEGSLKLLCLGEPQSMVLLEEAAQQHQLLVNRIALPEFSESDTADYLKYRLDAVGYNKSLPFTELQLKALSIKAKSGVAFLNQSARGMLIAAIDTRAARAKSFPTLHFLLIVMLLSFVFFIAFNQRELAEEAPANTIVLEGTLEAREPNDSGAQGLKEPSGVEDNTLLPAETAQTELSENSTAPSELAAVQLALDEAVAESVDTPPSDDVRQPVVANDAKSIEPVGQDDTQDTGDKLDNVTDRDTDITAVDDGGALETEEATQQSFVPQTVFESGSQAVMTWSQLGYALQVFGSHNAKSAKQLVKKYSESINLYTYETLYDGKPWFVVINGPYEDRNAAKQNIQQLPDELRRLRPWPRNISSIQADINRQLAR